MSTRIHKMVIALDQCELAMRMIEAAHEIARPPAVDPERLLCDMPPEISGHWQRASRAALEYFEEMAVKAMSDPASRPQ